MADMYEKMFETTLAHVGMWAEKANVLASHLYEMVEGADPGDCDAMADLIKYGYCDETGIWKED